MKTLKLSCVYLSFFIFFSCGSVSNYTNNSLNKEYYGNKTIYFTLSPNSVKEVTMSGLYSPTIFDDRLPPNIDEVFKESVDELASETKLNLKYIRGIENLSNNETVVIAEISEISWHFGLSTAKFKTKVNYFIQNLNKTYNIEGMRKSGGGSKSNNLKKSLKNATYNFLKEFEK